MKRHTIFQISDLHLSGQRAYNYANWQAALTHINQCEATLVVVSGDVCLDDPDCEADHDFARAQLARITGDWRIIAGNHDVGDGGPKPYRGQNINEMRLARYQRFFGSHYWAVALDDWLILGINSMLCGSNLAEERRQLVWLRQMLSRHMDKAVMMFSHKPLFINSPEEEIVSHWCVSPQGRQRLFEVLQDADIRLIASGHTHHYRSLMHESILYVWAPAVGHIDFSDPVPFQALPMSAIMRYELVGRNVEFTLVVPQGMTTWNAATTIKASSSLRFAPLLSPQAALQARNAPS